MLTFCIVLLSFNPLFACPLVCSHNQGSRSANPAGGKPFLFLLFFFFLHSPLPYVPCTIIISLFIMSLVNLSAFFLYVQILEFEMDFFSSFTQLNSFLCAHILWAKLIDPETGSS